MRACPYCASRIPDVAISCRFCGREVTPLSNARREPQGSAAGRAFTLVLLVILLVFLGVALLYAYRAQGASGPRVAYAAALSEIQSGQVRAVTITGDTATIVKLDGTSETVAIGTNDGGAFQKFIVDYNTTQQPNRQVDLTLQKDQSAFGLIGPALLAAAPLILLVMLVLFLAMQLARRADRR